MLPHRHGEGEMDIEGRKGAVAGIGRRGNAVLYRINNRYCLKNILQNEKNYDIITTVLDYTAQCSGVFSKFEV